MKKVGLWAGLLAFSLTPVCAQVSVEVRQEQEQFLQGESMPTMVRITNRSGQPLSLGADEDWLTFSVESLDGGSVPKLGEVPVAGAFVLESSKVAVKHVDLAPYFTFGDLGRYRVIATVRIRNWDHDVVSRPKHFDIIEGAKLWEQDFGVPLKQGATNPVPEVRKYVLQQANYLKGQLRLYLSVVDANSRVLRVLAIGQMLSFSRPDPQLDKASKLHLLYQNGPHTFSYTTYNPEGELVGRQTYEFGNSRPRLRIDEDGVIAVTGGMRRVSPNDLPPPPPMPEPSAAPKPAPAPTNGPSRK